ncbi:NAD(P)-binding protein [Hypomontagnella monticulosa]|nr:NAD(P)-binding protein [Hypomontagnella monticulosa]
MVKLNVVRTANAALADSAPKPFTAVVSGGTAGIGEATVRALAATFAGHGAPDGSDFLRVHIVGRNEAAARKIIDECTAVCPGGVFLFHKGDLSLLKEVDRVCADIAQSEKEAAGKRGEEPRIDFLVCCQGVLSLSREETEEGLDKFYCLMYYSRMRFVDRLLPLLTASPKGGHVVSVLNSKFEATLVEDDLSLRDPKNGSFQIGFRHRIGMMNLFIEEIAKRNPGKIALCHFYPGFVPTNIGDHSNFPWILKKIVNILLIPAFWVIGTPVEECGQRVVFMASPRFPARGNTEMATESVKDPEVAEGMDGIVGSGAYRVRDDDETYPKETGYNKLRESGNAEKVYQHTMTAFTEIEAGRVFKG